MSRKSKQLRKNALARLGFFLLWMILAASLLYWCIRHDRRFIRKIFIDDTRYSAEIHAAAARYQLPPQLIRALIRKESGFDPGAEGGSGEVGLMQLLPDGAVADWARVNRKPKPPVKQLYSVETNLNIGCWYLKRAMDHWQGYRCQMELALAEYNAGAKNAARWKPAKDAASALDKIDYPGTREYVSRIMKDYHRYLSETPEEKHL